MHRGHSLSKSNWNGFVTIASFVVLRSASSGTARLPIALSNEPKNDEEEEHGVKQLIDGKVGRTPEDSVMSSSCC